MNRNPYESFQNTAVIVILIAMIVTVVGVLALPIVMSIAYSWWWMFMYVAYLLAAVILACGFSSPNRGRSVNNENHSTRR